LKTTLICILIKALVLVDLLSNFLNPLNLFSGCGERFHKIAMTENGGGNEKKINGRMATANQVRDGWKELKQKYLQKEGIEKKTFKSHNLFEEPSTRYSCFPKIIYSHSVHILMYMLNEYNFNFAA
jgi:hypothetical protein